MRELRAIGYQHVTIDLQGYRMGSLNEGVRLRLRLTPGSRAVGATSAGSRGRVGDCSPLRISRPTFRSSRRRSKTSTRSTSRSGCATSIPRGTSRIRPAIRSTSRSAAPSLRGRLARSAPTLEPTARRGAGARALVRARRAPSALIAAVAAYLQAGGRLGARGAHAVWATRSAGRVARCSGCPACGR